MKVIQSNTKIMFEYDESGKKKYLHRIIWDEGKERATVIMLSAGSSEGIYFDRTTCNVLRNLMQLGFGSADIVNLFPEICNGKVKLSIADDKENIRKIEESAESADKIIYAVGTGHQNNVAFQKRARDVIAVISQYAKKCYCISDSNGQLFYHPLCPKVWEWKLVPLPFKKLVKAVTEK